jgi:hypothetical protein
MKSNVLTFPGFPVAGIVTAAAICRGGAYDIRIDGRQLVRTKCHEVVSRKPSELLGGTFVRDANGESFRPEGWDPV